MGAENIDAIFFDIDDTLYLSSSLADKARASAIIAMRSVGLNVPDARLHELLDEIIGEHSSNYPHQFDLILDRIPKDAYEPVNRSVIIAAGVAAYHDTKFRELKPFSDVIPALKKLRSASMQLGIITAGVPIKQAEKLVRMDVLEYFNPAWIFITDQMELSKQDGRLWRRVLELTELSPERVMYVGDHPTSDIDAPNDAGLLTVRMCRGGKYSDMESRTEPDYVVHDFNELLEVVGE